MSNEEAIGHLRTIIIFSEIDGYTDIAREALKMAIGALQERKTGEWKDHSICSCCGWYLKNRFGFAEDVNFPYCPHCGAKMEVDNADSN